MAALMRKAYATAAANSKAAFATQKQAHDVRAKERYFKAGDRVYIRSTRDVGVGKKLAPKFRGPFFVVRRVHRDVYELRRNRSHRLQTTHAQDLKLVPFEPRMFLQDTAPLADSCSPSASASGTSPRCTRPALVASSPPSSPLFLGDDPPRRVPTNPLVLTPAQPGARRPRRIYSPATQDDVAGNTRARVRFGNDSAANSQSQPSTSGASAAAPTPPVPPSDRPAPTPTIPPADRPGPSPAPRSDPPPPLPPRRSP